MKVSTILDQIDGGALALPKFQRGFVWNRDQARGLMEALDPCGGGSIRSLRQAGAVSSDGESVRFTPGRSQVRILHRPPRPAMTCGTATRDV